MADRSYSCQDCGAEGLAGKAGPLPQRCSPCKRRRLSARERERVKSDPEYRGRQLDASRAWAQRNPARVREVQREYWRKNPDKKRAKDQRYYKNNRDRVRAANDAWLAENAERMSEWRRRYYEENRERFRDAGSLHYERTKEDYCRRAAERRARKMAAQVEHVDRDVVWARDDGVCHLCRKPADPNDWHLEHIVPLIRGGDHSYANTAVSHPACNRAKGARMP